MTGERGTGKELVARAIHDDEPAGEGPAREAQLRGPARVSSSSRSSSATRRARSPARPSSAAASSSARRAARSFSTRSATCRCRCRRSSSACSRSGRSSAWAATRPSPWTCEGRRGDQPRPRRRLRERRLPRRPLRPPQRASAGHPPLARPSRRHPLLAAHFLELAAQVERPPRHAPRAGRRRRARELRLAGQRPRAPERHRAPGHPDARRRDPVADDVRNCLPGGSAAKAAGLYRPGVPFRVLVEEAERVILAGGARASRLGRWRRPRARSTSSAATSTRRRARSGCAGTRERPTTRRNERCILWR